MTAARARERTCCDDCAYWGLAPAQSVRYHYQVTTFGAHTAVHLGDRRVWAARRAIAITCVVVAALALLAVWAVAQ